MSDNTKPKGKKQLKNVFHVRGVASMVLTFDVVAATYEEALKKLDGVIEDTGNYEMEEEEFIENGAARIEFANSERLRRKGIALVYYEPHSDIEGTMTRPKAYDVSVWGHVPDHFKDQAVGAESDERFVEYASMSTFELGVQE